MVITNLDAYFGKAISNVARDLFRPIRFKARCSQLVAGFGRGSLGDVTHTGALRSHAEEKRKTRGGTSCCEKKFYYGFGMPSIFARALPVRPMNNAALVKCQRVTPQVRVIKVLKGSGYIDRSRHQTKGFLNVTNDYFTKPFKRSICVLAKSMVESRISPQTMPQLLMRPVIRKKSFGRENCAEWCGEDRCRLPRKESVEKASMWISPRCHKNVACKPILRHDIIHMPGSDKATREYQQTWVECPVLHCAPKPKACLEGGLPPICRRPRKVRPVTAECMKAECKPKKKSSKCPKIEELPCCEKGREPPSCKIFPTPSCCQKRCTPFPSFSECCKPHPNRKRPIECLCLVRPTLCEVWADWRRKQMGTG